MDTAGIGSGIRLEAGAARRKDTSARRANQMFTGYSTACSALRSKGVVDCKGVG